MTNKNLIQLYEKTSKHSHYQVLADSVLPLLNGVALNTQSRHEKERLSYILNYIDFMDRDVIDVGGNTGFFSFTLLEHGAKHVRLIEGNQAHCEFVSEAAIKLKQEHKLLAENKHFDFEHDVEETTADVILLLNVLHHVGDDFNGTIKTTEQAKRFIVQAVNRLATNTTHLVLQLGFNWQGNTEKPLFDNGTKREVIDFVEQELCENWNIVAIGIAEPTGNNRIHYADMSPENERRNDSLGEFLNRPLFILKSKQHD